MKNNYFLGVLAGVCTALVWGAQSPIAKIISASGVSQVSVSCSLCRNNGRNFYPLYKGALLLQTIAHFSLFLRGCGYSGHRVQRYGLYALMRISFRPSGSYTALHISACHNGGRDICHRRKADQASNYIGLPGNAGALHWFFLRQKFVFDRNITNRHSMGHSFSLCHCRTDSYNKKNFKNRRF